MRQFDCGSCKQSGRSLDSCIWCGGSGVITDPGCETLVPNFTSMVRCGADTCNVTRTRCSAHMPPRVYHAPILETCESCEQETEYLNDDAQCENCAFESAVSAADALHDFLKEGG
jgi:hypothetical protein